MKQNIHPLDVALSACINGQPEISENILRNYPQQDDPRVVFNLGWHEMRHGRIKSGLQMMDAGRYINVFGIERIRGDIWRNQPLHNKTLLFRCENGYGDQIMNFRFAKDFEKLGARVVVSCCQELMPLFSSQGFICVDNRSVDGVHYDYWVPSMSSAHVLGYDSDNFPGSAYITAQPRKLGTSDNKNLKVGLRWSGNPQFEHEQHRKFDPTPLIDLYKLPGVTMYSLQRDYDLRTDLPFTDLGPQLKTWTDTAEIISGLDLVISSCTSVAHLAAAMGKETWVIVPVMPYYTWAAPGDRSVWYNSARVFRQEKYGCWSKPLELVEAALKDKLGITE
jgi:hypothetical protein